MSIIQKTDSRTGDPDLSHSDLDTANLREKTNSSGSNRTVHSPERTKARQDRPASTSSTARPAWTTVSPIKNSSEPDNAQVTRALSQGQIVHPPTDNSGKGAKTQVVPLLPLNSTDHKSNLPPVFKVLPMPAVVKMRRTEIGSELNRVIWRYLIQATMLQMRCRKAGTMMPHDHPTRQYTDSELKVKVKLNVQLFPPNARTIRNVSTPIGTGGVSNDMLNIRTRLQLPSVVTDSKATKDSISPPTKHADSSQASKATQRTYTHMLVIGCQDVCGPLIISKNKKKRVISSPSHLGILIYSSRGPYSLLPSYQSDPS